MSDGASEIIIKGGSVEIDFDDSIYHKRNGDPKIHESRDRKITRIGVVDESGGEKFDSGDEPGGLKWMVTVSTK